MILYQGLLSSPASWARVGRGYLGALIEMGVEVAAVSARGFRYDPNFPLPTGLRQVSVDQARRDDPPEIGLGFLHPPNLGRLLGRFKANLCVCEADRVPASWIEPLNRDTDVVLVPSQFTKRAMMTCGVCEDRILVVPYGYQPQHVSNRKANRSAAHFTYLSIAAPHWRKGVRELLLAYREAFTSKDDVLLVIKSTYDPGQARRRFPFEIPSWAELLARCGLNDPQAPAVELNLETLVDDQEVMALYDRADVYVAPTWGESFGLALLDALATATPVIATGWSAHTEFVPAGLDLIPYQLTKADDKLYEPARGAQAAIPKVLALAQRMRWHRDHPAQSQRLGKDAQAAVTHLTWTSATKQLLRDLRASMVS